MTADRQSARSRAARRHRRSASSRIWHPPAVGRRRRPPLDVLRTADLGWIVLLMVVSVVLDVAARGARWRALLAPIAALAVPARARLHVRRLPRQQRPAGPARRAGPQPRPGRGGGHEPDDGPRHGRRRAGRRHRHRRRVGRVSVVVLDVRGIVASAVSCSAPAFVGILVVGLVVAIAEPSTAGRGPRQRRTPSVGRGSSSSARRLREGLAVVGPAADARRGARVQRARVDGLDPDIRPRRPGGRHRADGRRRARCSRAASPSPRSCRPAPATSARSS